MSEERSIPFKNYIILSIILILSVIIVIYFYMWYSEFQTSKINTPILDEYMSVINYNELDDYLVENKNAVLYISVLDDIKTRQFEKKFKKIIEKYALNNSVLYLDLTHEKDSSYFYQSILSKYDILDLPCIIIVEENKVIDVYSIKDNNYDLELLVSYLKIVGVIND